MISCPNPNLGINKVVYEKYDMDTLHYFRTLLGSQAFVDWKGDAKEPVIDDNLIATSNRGTKTDLKKYLDEFYKSNQLLKLKQRTKDIKKESVVSDTKSQTVEVRSKTRSRRSAANNFLRKATKFYSGIMSEKAKSAYAIRLQAFNQKYGTRHSFTVNQIGHDNLTITLNENWNNVDPFQLKLFKEMETSSRENLFELGDNYNDKLSELAQNARDNFDFLEDNGRVLAELPDNALKDILNDLENSENNAISELMFIIKDKIKLSKLLFFTNDSAIDFKEHNIKTIYGFYNEKDKRMYINLDQNSNNSKLIHTFMHELVHAAISAKVYQLSLGIGTEEELEIYRKLDNLRLELKSIEGFEEKYGLKNNNEFIAELLSNKEFVNDLNGIKSKTEKSILDQIFDYLADLLGINKDSVAFDALKYAMQIIEASSVTDELTDEQRVKIKEKNQFLIKSEVNDIITEIEEEGKEWRDSDDKEGYVHINDASRSVERAHKILDNINPDIKTTGPDQFDTIARRIFRSRNKSIENDRISYGGSETELSFEELKIFLENNSKIPIVKGNIIHKVIQNPDNYISIQDLKDDPEIAKEADEAGLDLNTLSWMFLRTNQDDDTSPMYIERMARELGLDEDIEAIMSGLNARAIHSEVRIVNEEAGFGSTADIVVVRGNGTVSLYEIKSGNSLLRTGFDDAIIQKYAKKHKIKFSKLTQAQIQVMVNALGLKAKNRDIKFSNIDIVYANYRHMKSGFPSRITTFDKQKILDLLADYFMDKNPEWYRANKDLFKFENYGELSYEFQKELSKYNIDNIGKLSSLYSEQVRQLSQLIETLKRNMRVEPSEKLYMTGTKLSDITLQDAEQMRQDLAKKVLQIENRGRVDFDAKVKMSWLMSTFGNKRYISNKTIAKLRMFIEKGRRDFEDRRFDLYRQEQDLFKPIFEEYKRSHPAQKFASTITADAVNMVKYKDMFDFMWEETENGKFYVTEKSEKWNTLTEDQKVYSQFVRMNLMKEFYRTMSPKSLVDILSKRLDSEMYSDEIKEQYRQIIDEFSKLDNYNVNKLSGIPRFEHFQNEWDDSFAPRVPIKLSEQYEHVGGIKNSLKFMKDVVKNSFYDPLDSISKDNQLMSGMQLKYMGGASMIENENYSLNTSIAFFQFISNVVAKNHLDDSYAIARTFRDMHQLGDNMTGEEFDETAKFIDDVLINNLILQKPRKKVEQTQIITAMRMATSLAYIGLRYTAGIKNAIFEFLNNARKAIAGTLGPKGYADFTIKDLAKATSMWIYYKIGSIKDPADNKLHNILKRYKLDTDDFEYRVRKNDLIGGKNKLLDIGLAFKTHSIFENMTNQTAMMAQMIHNGTWDKHDNKGNWVGGVRAVVETASGKKEISGLTYQEVEKMRAIGEQLHGGYREDEKSSMEFTFLGDLAMQFHKFVPAYINNSYAGTYNREELGKWIETGEFTLEDGKIVPIWEWEDAVFTGEVTLLGKTMQTFFRRMMRDVFAMDAITYDQNYRLKNLSPEQKKQLMSLAVRISMYAALYLAIAAMYADVPDDDRWKKQMKGLPDDVLGGMNVNDLTRIINEPFISFGLAKDVSVGLKEYFVNGLIFGEKYKTGKNKGKIKGSSRLKKFLPFRSLFVDLEDKYDW